MSHNFFLCFIIGVNLIRLVVFDDALHYVREVVALFLLSFEGLVTASVLWLFLMVP